MFDWLRRLFETEDDKMRRFLAMVDTLHAAAGGGEPTPVERQLGMLKLPSRTLVLGDPQYLPSLEIPDFGRDEVSISATLLQYPRGDAGVAAVTIAAAGGAPVDSYRKIGEVNIDSAVLVIVDKANFDEHWTHTGVDRIGEISTARDHELHRYLKQRFNIRTLQVNVITARIVGAVSVELEEEIIAYLKSVPRYAQFPFMNFTVRTNNSFDRVNYMPKPYDFMPVGNSEHPKMFACRTGRGDGTYGVTCGFAGDSAVTVTIPFMEAEGDPE